ncbi:MAG TPA: hypothetical protein VEJ84_08615, partial [Acidimicrobiales bacterium]|nr:hypothetical protein [Acidimicrobiales bacterium]
EHAIAAARTARRHELLPLRSEVAEAIEKIGWRSARPVVEEVLGVHAAGPHGGWWSRVGKRNGPVLLRALAAKSEEGELSSFFEGA